MANFEDAVAETGGQTSALVVGAGNSGVFVAIAGPSGAGKDSLLAGAAAALSGNPHMVFARRVITRPMDSSEPFETATIAEFQQRAAEGGFLFWWEANGHHYGLPVALANEIAAGYIVVANVSRAVIKDIRARFAHVVVVHVTASSETLEARLLSRGRETQEQCRQRLARALEKDAMVKADLRIENDGPLQHSVDRFVGALNDLLKKHAPDV